MKIRNGRKHAEQQGKTIVKFPKGERKEGKAIQRLDARRKDYTLTIKDMKGNTEGYHKPGRMK